VNAYKTTEMVTIFHGETVDVLRSIESESIDLIVTSPPYNCRKQYAGISDEMPWSTYYSWMQQVITECYRVLCPGGTLAVNVPSVIRYQHDHQFRATWSDFDKDYPTHRESEKVTGRGRIEPIGFQLFTIMQSIDNHVREPIIWVKGSEEGEEICSSYQMGSDNNPYMRPCHEFILLGSKSQWYHRGGTGRRGADAVPFIDYTKDVWYIQPISKPQHPAVFPEEIPIRLIRLFVHSPDAVVLDPFMGSGTTLKAAEKLGYKSIGIDASREYCNFVYDEFRQVNMFTGMTLPNNVLQLTRKGGRKNPLQASSAVAPAFSRN
jgi:DNA modification methylase